MGSSRTQAIVLATLLASARLIAPTPSGSGDLTPIVAPDRLEDAPTNSRDVLANFAWRAFIALNWPSLTEDRGRGEPDREMQFGDHGKRVWETFKSDAELFRGRRRRPPGRARALGKPCRAEPVRPRRR